MVLGLFLAQILPEKINKMLSSNNPGFIDVNRTVFLAGKSRCDIHMDFSPKCLSNGQVKEDSNSETRKCHLQAQAIFSKTFPVINYRE